MRGSGVGGGEIRLDTDNGEETGDLGEWGGTEGLEFASLKQEDS